MNVAVIDKKSMKIYIAIDFNNLSYFTCLLHRVSIK